jgi:DNA-binding beta-propeller fold protein YncE
MSDSKSRWSKAVSISALVVMLLTGSPKLWSQVERPATWGRRLACGPSGLLALTIPEPPGRVVLYNVSGDAPVKVATFGERGWAAGQFDTPHGAAVSWNDELLVTNTNNDRIDVFDMASLREGRYPRLLRTIGTIGTTPGRFEVPQWPVAVSSRRDLQQLVFVSDTGNDRIQVFEHTGKLLRILGGHGSEDGKLDRPMGIAFDPSGSLLYVVENGNRRISVFAAKSGAFVGKFAEAGPGGVGLAIPQGLAVGPDGVLYVADMGPRRIRRFKPEFSPSGKLVGAKELPAWGKDGTGPGEFLKPYAVAVDFNGRVYVADFGNDRCQSFTSEGVFLSAFGEDATELSHLSPPAGLTARLPETVCSNGGTFRLRIKSRNPIPANEMMGLEAEILEGCGEDAKPAEGVRLAVSGFMPEHQHGMTTQAQVTQRADGRFDVAGLLFHMPGYWELRFDIRREDVVERAQLGFKLE